MQDPPPIDKPGGEDKGLEAPAYLGRPFPGTTRYPLNPRPAALVALTTMFALGLLGASINFVHDNTLFGSIFGVVMVAALVGAIFVVRREVRREMRHTGRSPRDYR